jgi:hypothetical protein
MNLALEAPKAAGVDGGPDVLERVADLPVDLLDVAERRNPVLAERRREVAEVRDHVKREARSRALWRDPEVFHPIVSLADEARERARADELLERLRLVLGLRSPETASLPDGFYRLAHRTGELVLCADGELRRFTSGWHLPSDDGLRVYLPIPELFRDILAEEIYPSDAPLGDLDRAAGVYRRSMALVAAYDSSLHEDFLRTLSTVVLLPPVPHAPAADDPSLRWSFNLRLRYFGAIFVNPFLVDEFGLAEGLIHEYIHQRFWLWWELDPPAGLPRGDATVRSPVTGARRPAAVMLQALFIYANALHFHESALAGTLGGPAASPWAAARAALLRRALPELAERLLNDVIAPSSGIGAAVRCALAELGLDRRPLTTPARWPSASASASAATAPGRSDRS